jgi:hypothetical protein
VAIDVAYRPRNPETTLLYQVVDEQLETFLATQQERDRPVPDLSKKHSVRFWIAEFSHGVSCGFTARTADRIGCWRSPVKLASGARRVVEDA